MVQALAVIAAVAPRDMLFASKIQGTGRGLGVRTLFGGTAEELLARGQEAAARSEPPGLVVLDLGLGDLALGALRLCKADPAFADARFIGYAAHIDGAAMTAAREAGCEFVMPRSALSSDLYDIMLNSCLRSAGQS